MFSVFCLLSLLAFRTGLVHSICANWISVVLVSAAFVLTLMFRSNPTALPIAMAKPLEQKEDRRKPASVPPPKTDVHPPSVPPPKTDVHPPQATGWLLELGDV